MPLSNYIDITGYAHTYLSSSISYRQLFNTSLSLIEQYSFSDLTSLVQLLACINITISLITANLIKCLIDALTLLQL